MKKAIIICLVMIESVIALKAKNVNREKLEERLDSLMATSYTDDAPGAALLVADGDDILFDKGYGLADTDTKQKITGKTNFNIASLSKQFTVAGILKLQEDGMLLIEDPVSKYMPEFRRDMWQRVKLRHLMSHSSGVPDLRPREDRNFTLFITDEQSIEYMHDLDSLKFYPGTAYDYINPTFQILYAIIQKLSGTTFDNYQRQKVFVPSKMTDIRYFSPDTTIPNMAHGYIIDGEGADFSIDSDSQKKRDKAEKVYVDSNGRKWAECDYGEETFFATKSDGGIYTNTHELLKWELALDENRCLTQKSKELAYTKWIKVSGSKYCSYQNRPNTWYGLGWFIEELPNGKSKIYHTGDNGGFQANLAKYTDSRIKVIMLENRNDINRWSMQLKIEQILREEGAL